MHRRADGAGGVRGRLGTDRAEHPAQRAALERLDRRRAHAHVVVLRHQRRVVGERRQPPPAGRARAGHALVGQAPQHRGGGRAALGRGLRVGQGTAELGHEGGQGEGPRQLGERSPVLRGRGDQVEEAGGVRPGVGAVQGALHGGDDQAPAGARAGDVEQPPLLGQGEGAPVDAGAVDARGPFDQLLDAEQRGAFAQVGPDPLLHAGDADHVPLQPLGGVGGEQPDRLAPGRPRGPGVARQLLGREVGDEGPDVGRGQPVDEAGGGVEQRDDGVEVAVGHGAGRARRRRSPGPTSRPRPLRCHIAQSTSSAVPSWASASRPAARTSATRRAGRETCSGSDSSRSSSASAVASGAPRSAASMPRLASSMRTARRIRRRSRTVAPPSGEASSASAAGSSSPTAAPSASGPEPDAGSSAVSALSSGATAGCPASGSSSAETATGTPAEDSARRSGPSATRRPDHHRHLRPRHAVEQVRAAQHVGQVGGLDRRGGEDVHLGGARFGALARATSRRCSHGPGSPSATFRLIRSSSSPERRQTPRETRRAGRPSVCRNRSGNSTMPRGSAPRKA